MPMRAGSLLCCLTAALLLGGRRAGAQDHQVAVLTTERLTADLSRDSGFTTALLRNAHPTAVLLWPGAPVTAGIADIGRLLTVIDSDSLLLTWQPLQIELAQDSTLAATWGVAVAGGRHDARSASFGRYIATWRRDGSRWTIAALVFSGFRGLPAPVLPPGLRRELPPVKSSGPAGPFVTADLSFAQLAADSGAGRAFQRWAAPEAVMFGGRGLLIRPRWFLSASREAG